MIKIALAEDNSFLSNSLINKLGLFDEFKVKYHAVNGQELLVKLQDDSNIDVILMDIQMPEMNGIQATKAIAQKYPQIKVIMLTILDEDQTVYEAIQAGAIGYLVKESSPQEIYDGIIQSLSGGAALSPNIALKAMKIIQNQGEMSKEASNFDLSERELQVLQQLTKGLNYKQIASNLIISPNTVRRHLENIYKKLGVTNKVEATQKAYRNNLV
ncbi:MAG: response regulator transcription factor [Crocinitomicaceae bacterium]|nr:response regulator transcription factor [Crocinitomicaceae bacterium]